MSRALLSIVRAWRRWLAGLALALGAGSAQALCIGACSCSVNTSTATLNFGSYNPFGSSPLTGTSSIKVGCSGGVAGLGITYKIHLSRGSGSSFATRRLVSGSNLLTYNLYTDSNYVAIWGDNTAGSVEVWGGIALDVLGLSQPNTHWIYGVIPAGQRTAVPSTTYTDAITVTVTYY